MKYTLSEQIQAIQEARRILKTVDCHPELDAKLNDAGSTIAAINLSPEDSKRVFLHPSK